MLSSSLTTLACVLSLGTVVRGYADPEPCSGDCYAHDPGLMQRSSDKMYFRFNTDVLVDIMKSDSLSGPWELVGNVLPDGSSIDIADDQGYWAPALIEKDGTYICYYSVSTGSSQVSAIGYATSSTMENGSWTDHGTTGVESTTSSAFNAIDPAVIEVDGSYYMNWGSYWMDIYVGTLNANAETVQDLSGATQLSYLPAGMHQREAGFLYEYDSNFYLFFSEGQANRYDTDKPAAGGEYKVRVCRSATITGTYTDSNGTSCLEGGGDYVLESHGEVYGPGGQGIFDDPTHGVIMYYRYVNTSIGYAVADYQWGWNVLNWDSDGWPTV